MSASNELLARSLAPKKLIKKTVTAGAAVLLAGTVGLTGSPTAVAHGKHDHHGDPVRVITEGLNGPRQVSKAWGRLLVAESETGRITAVDPRRGRTRTLVSGLETPQGVAAADGRLYIAIGEGATGENSGLLVARPGGTPRQFADLTGYELENNPDGQTHFDAEGEPLDAISNPYFVLRDRRQHGFLLVADAGANDVLAVDRRGNVSTFFVPPTITTGACAEVPNNTPSGVGCDAVPTGLAYGPHGLLYISALTSEVPGEGRVYVVDRRGRLVRVIKGFSAPTGVAVDRHGTVYVSELLEGAPEGEGPPPPGFDPSTVGQIVAVTRHGRWYAQVTMPSGLLWQEGKLYASAWAVASFLGISDAGQVVTVRRAAFDRR
jgi:hypothetical protein